MEELARLQRKQLQEKEEKLIRLYQKQRAIDRIGGSINNNTPPIGGGKVRQMFDERRQKAGIDRSYPLEPLKQENSVVNNAPAPSKIAVRINANTRKTTTTLSTHRANGNVPRQAISKNSSTNNVINTISGNTTSYQSPEDIGYMFDKDVMNNMNRLNIENEMEDNAMRAHIEHVEAIYSGVGGKLANVGGKLRREVENMSKSMGGKVTSSVNKKDAKVGPLIQKATVAVKSPIRKVDSAASLSSPSSSASNMSRPQSRVNPAPSVRNDMKTRPNSNNPSHVAERTPNTMRPSAKQTPRGPSAVQRDDLGECRYCHRRFASDRLQTHEDICARTTKKKRKQYDPIMHRLDGTELAQFVPKSARNTGSKSRSINDMHTSKKKIKATTKPNNWRQKHEEFVATIRSAKMAQQHVAKGGKLSDLPPPPPSSNPDFVQCPHCGRRFNEAAAERHIPKCANYDYNKPKSGASKGRAR